MKIAFVLLFLVPLSNALAVRGSFDLTPNCFTQSAIRHAYSGDNVLVELLIKSKAEITTKRVARGLKDLFPDAVVDPLENTGLFDSNAEIKADIVLSGPRTLDNLWDFVNENIHYLDGASIGDVTTLMLVGVSSGKEAVASFDIVTNSYETTDRVANLIASSISRTKVSNREIGNKARVSVEVTLNQGNVGSFVELMTSEKKHIHNFIPGKPVN